MLDENLPTFLLKPANDKPKQNSTFYYSQYGSDLEPLYSFRHPDPELHESKNRYAAALYDAYNPEILFAEVLLIPEWTQPNVSAEAIRLNGGVPPPPEPILPSEFTVQLYNPDQQVVVKQRSGSWGGGHSWVFEMPQHTFRQPSASSIDKALHDPAASDVTPKIGFKWKKDGKLSKDLACFLLGKSTNPDGSKKKNREPDITVAIFKALKEVTLYEPNLQRVEMEDLKGLEVVLLLGAVVIRDVYFGRMNEAFNIKEPSRPSSNSPSPGPTAPLVGLSDAPSTGRRGGHTSPPGPTVTIPPRDPRVPPTDPRSQWEIDAETARLQMQAEAEQREHRRRHAAEQKQIRKMLEAEEREKKRQQAEIERETERLKRLYGQEQQQARPSLPIRPAAQQHLNTPDQYHRPQTRPQYSFQQNHYQQNAWGQPIPENGPYMSLPESQSQIGFLSHPPSERPPRLKPKSSFFGFKREGDDPRLQKKRSSMF